MSSWKHYVQQGFRALAVLGAVLALASLLVVFVVGLKIASLSGVEIYVSVPITEMQAQQYGLAGVAGLFGGVVLNFFGNTVSNFVQGFRAGEQVPASAATSSAGDASAAPTPVSERYRQRLEKVYAANAGLLWGVIVVALVGSNGSGFGGSSLSILGRLAELVTVVLFGGVGGAAFVALVLSGLWYGVRRKSSESLLAGFVFALLFLPTALVLESAGFVIFALWLLYYNFLSRGATEFRLLGPDTIPTGVQQYLE